MLHLLGCLLQGFGLSLLITGGMVGLAYLACRLDAWLARHIGDWAIAVTISGLMFVVLGVVITLACLGILH